MSETEKSKKKYPLFVILYNLRLLGAFIVKKNHMVQKIVRLMTPLRLSALWRLFYKSLA